MFACAAVALWLLFLVQAFLTPVLLDDWYQLTYWRHHDFGLAAIWEYGHYNYFHFNPRIGDVLLAIVNGPRVIHLVVTPLVQLAVLPITFAIAFARWPRATLRDLQLLAFLQLMIWLVIPIPGVIYFYRPFATNYLWAFTITCTLFVPYRLALARPDDARARLWLALVMLCLGWLAGMSNEHTGPTAMVALLIFVYVAYRKRKLRVWMIAGLVGLYIGYPMLFFAPGQAVRYAGLATRDTPLHLLAERGFNGTFEILLEFVSEAQIGLDLFVVAVLVYLAAFRRRGEPVPALPRTTIVTATALILASGAIVVTLFASPTASERLFYASAILLVAALLVFAERLYDEPRTRRFLAWTTAILLGYHAFRFVQTYVNVKAENDERLEILRTTPKGTVAHVPPMDFKRRTRWHWGDDFRYASLREYVGNEVFDLAGIELTDEVRWAQPSPADHYQATRIYDPPLPPDVAAKIAPVAYIPTYWEWAINQLRRLLVTTDLGNYQGHKLVRYVVESQGLPFDDPKHRPLVVVDWTPKGFDFVDGRPYDDSWARPYIRVWDKSVPKHLTDTYVVACGQTRHVELVPDEEEHVGPLVPISLDCRGLHTAILCEPDRCWLAGRYWR
ncbi:MAG TPA: DUF6056 family protein [Kofleriaceae bacterium]|nr:DUF6056 family protein [Kofleriaceae bacterium]